MQLNLVVLRLSDCGDAVSWAKQSIGVFKPLKGSLHQNPGIYFKKGEGGYVRVDKGGKDAVADSLLILCPSAASAACLSTASTILISPNRHGISTSQNPLPQRGCFAGHPVSWVTAQACWQTLSLSQSWVWQSGECQQPQISSCRWCCMGRI